MTASLLPNGKQQFTDTNGNPLVAGTVTFYIPNTSTLKATWQDAQQTIPNANPVTLDSLGSAVIYGSGQYRQVVKDAPGNVIWDQPTQDYLTQVTQALNQNQTLTTTGQAILSTALFVYINPGSAGAGTYLLPATPATGETHWVNCTKGDEGTNNQTISGNGRTIDGNSSYLFKSNYQSAGFSFNGAEWSILAYNPNTQKMPFSVTAFGAKGDGVTDDTVAAQACFEAARVAGAAVYVPSGNYLVSNLLYGTNTVGSQSSAPSALIGDGHSSVFTAKTGTTGTLLKATNISEQNWSNFHINSQPGAFGLIGLDTSYFTPFASLGGAYRYITVDSNNLTQAWLANNNNDVTFDTITCSNLSNGAGLKSLSGGGSLYLNNPRMLAPLWINAQQFSIIGGGIILGLQIGTSAGGSSSNFGTIIGTQLAATTALPDSNGNPCAVLNASDGLPYLSFKAVFFILNAGSGTSNAVGMRAGNPGFGGLEFNTCIFSGTSGLILSDSLVSPNGVGSPVVAKAVNCNFAQITARGTLNNQVLLAAVGCSGSPNAIVYGGEVFAPAVANGWVTTGAIFGVAPLSITRNGNNVQLAGALTGGTTTDGVTVFTLPIGLRPALVTILVCSGFTGTIYKSFEVIINNTVAAPAGAVMINGVAAAGITTLVFNNSFICTAI